MRILGAWVYLALPASALAAETEVAAEGHARVTLVTDVETVPAGEPFRVGVRFELDPEWHVYWHNPGQAGIATELAWKSGTVTVGATQWPAPHRFATEDGFIITQGYEKDVLLFAEARATASGPLEVTVDFLVCQIDCIPGSVVLTRTIQVGPTRVPANAALFDAAAAQVPRALSHPVVARQLRVDGQALSGELAVRAPGHRLLPDARGSFFTHRVPGIELFASAGAQQGDELRLTLDGKVKKLSAPEVPVVLVLLDAAGNRTAYELTIPLAAPPVAAAAPTVAPAPPLGLGTVLWFAFLGGLILNLMPCVLPVLALKVGGLARLAGVSRRARAGHAFAYLGGIQAALAILAAIVLGLRLAGTQVGWGFQFQQPLFLALVGGLLVVLAMNAFGAFEMDVGGVANHLAERVDATKGGRKSFGEGALAVVLATPCSAPFVGSALGYALAAPPATVLLVFAALGLGLWLPFGLLAVSPGGTRFLPRPGRWMIVLKQAVGFTLIGAALWLLWVAARAAGTDGAAQIGLFWLALAVGAWIFGLGRRKGIALAMGLAIAVAAGLFTLRFDPPSAASAETVTGWDPWTKETVDAKLAQGKTVFVDFTADWCITCKVNERTAIAADKVQALVADRDIAMLRADWTRPDDRIRAELARHGRAGVPMYLVYSPGRPDAPDVLPEVLTPGIVHEALDRASRATD